MAQKRVLIEKGTMESSMEPELDTRGVVPIENPQKSSHGTPGEGCHGLCLPNPCRAAYLGGVSSGKTNALLCTLGQCHAWRPFKHIYLMSPNNETTRKGEYGVLDDVTCLDHWPTLDYWESRPGRSALIVDDISWSLSKRGSPSQHELNFRDVLQPDRTRKAWIPRTGNRKSEQFRVGAGRTFISSPVPVGAGLVGPLSGHAGGRPA